MKKIILLALLAAAFVAMPAFASVNNIKVSGSVDSTWLNRANFDLGANNIGDETQNLGITQTMVQVDAELTENVSTTVCLINERAWTAKNASAAGDNINIHYAYATLREMLYSPLTVVVGRQAFKYGNSFVVDSTGTNNSAPADSGIQNVAGDLTKQTAQDAVRLIFDYNPLTLELLFSKITANNTNLVRDEDDDIDLYGLNTSYELGDAWKTMVEGYFFARIDKSVTQTLTGGTPGIAATGTAGGSKSDTIYVPGLRASTNPIEGLNLQGEFAWQGGNRATTASKDNQRRNAVGAQVIANYQLPVLKEYKPTAEYVYTYVSGDRNASGVANQGNAGSRDSSSERWYAWDPMFENQGGGKIYNAIFNLTNLNIHTASLAVSPIEDVTTKFSWTGLWLDKKYDTATTTLVQPDNQTSLTGTGTGAVVNVNRNKKDLGFELDLDATYDYTEDVQIGASLGWFMPGDVFDAAGTAAVRNKPDNTASQALVHMNVNF